MRAALFVAPRQPVELTRVPVPEPGPLDVLVRVEACGICLSDVHLIDGSIPPVRQPVIPGHEAAGVIERVGDLVTGWHEGQRVSLAGGKSCGRCERCVRGDPDACLDFEIMGFHYDGAWAEYVVVPFDAVAAVPDEVRTEHAAILADAVATPYAALKERAALRAGESVGLWGIGGLGTHAVQIARLLGAAPVIAIDPLEAARRRALAAGADIALDPTTDDVRDEIALVTEARGLDVAVDLVGANAVMKEAVSCLGRRGRLVMVGLSTEPLHLGPGILLGVQSQSILGHLGYHRRHLEELLGLVASRRLDLSESISEVIPLEEVEKGVHRLAEKIGDPVRILVAP